MPSTRRKLTWNGFTRHFDCYVAYADVVAETRIHEVFGKDVHFRDLQGGSQATAEGSLRRATGRVTLHPWGKRVSFRSRSRPCGCGCGRSRSSTAASAPPAARGTTAAVSNLEAREVSRLGRAGARSTTGPGTRRSNVHDVGLRVLHRRLRPAERALQLIGWGL